LTADRRSSAAQFNEAACKIALCLDENRSYPAGLRATAQIWGTGTVTVVKQVPSPYAVEGRIGMI